MASSAAFARAKAATPTSASSRLTAAAERRTVRGAAQCGLRFYSGRLTLRFDWVQKEFASQVVPAVERAGYRNLIVDDGEIPQARAQLGVPAISPLPWPIVARMRELGGVTVFDMATHPESRAPLALEPVARHWSSAPKRAPI